jgi:hypothetical protein
VVLFLHTETPTRCAMERERPPGRLVLASDAITAEDVAFYDAVVELPATHDVAGTLRALDEVACDEVVVQTEYGLLAGSLFARRRGLAAPSPEAASLTTNKWLCRETLRAAQVRVPRYALAETAADVRRFAEGAAVVIKPVASTLGHLVAKVERPDAAEDAVARMREELPRSPHVARLADFARIAELDLGCDPTRQFLVEEFVDGTPRETDGLVFCDRVDLFGVTEQIMSPPPGFFIEGYLFPVTEPTLEATTRAAVAALGLRDAGFSVEFRGETVIEVNGRLGEDGGFPELFRAELGRTPIAKWLDRDVGRRAATPGGHALAYTSWYRGGVVRAVTVDGADVVPLVAAGDRLFAPPDPRTAPHLAYAIASHPDGARAAYARARAALRGARFDVDAACAS